MIKNIAFAMIFWKHINYSQKLWKGDTEGSELHAMQSPENELKSINYVEMEINNNTADDETRLVLQEFNKIYKNAENNNY